MDVLEAAKSLKKRRRRRKSRGRVVGPGSLFDGLRIFSISTAKHGLSLGIPREKVRKEWHILPKIRGKPAH